MLWPRLQLGGLLYIDDYFSYGGARLAVDAWLQRKGWTAAAQALATTKRYPWHLYKEGPFAERAEL